MQQTIDGFGPHLRLTDPVSVNSYCSGETKIVDHGEPFGRLNLMDVVFHGYQYVKSIIQSIKMAHWTADMTYPNIYKGLIFSGSLENGYTLLESFFSPVESP